MRCVSLILVLLAATPADSWSARETGSIAPEIPLPTPYGLELVRSEDYLREQAAAGRGEEREPVDGKRLAHYENLIETGEDQGGAYAPQLAEALEDLAAAYRSREEYESAIGAYKRAVHVTRINRGLYTAAQIPLLEQLIETHLAAGDQARADQLQEYLYRVRKHHTEESPEDRLQAASAYTDWQRQAYLNGLGGNTYLRLLEIHTVHTKEVDRIAARDEQDPLLIPHLYRLLGSEYLLSQYEGEKPPEFQINIRQGSPTGLPARSIEEARFQRLENNIHRRGKQLLERIVALERQKGEGIAVVEAMVALGDWYQWSEWRARARKTYEQAFALLADGEAVAAQRQRLFGAPVELPASPVFRRGGELPAEAPEGRATVSFTVTRYGRARNIEVLQLEPADSAGARIAVIKLLRELRFRPRMEAGAPVDTERVVRDYHFDY